MQVKQSAKRLKLPDPAAADKSALQKNRIMTLRPGEFFLFHQLILHASPPNQTTQRRAGLACRFLTGGAEGEGLSDPCILVAGECRNPSFRLTHPPTGLYGQSKLRRWTRRFLKR